jgi:DNA-binding response OmpR family regulator
MRVLIADDDPVVRFLVEATLQSLGHKVCSCEDGDHAWLALQGFDPQIVVSDWMMPGINGIELCRRLRGQQGPPIFFILISSALNTNESQHQAAEAGVDDFIRKPLIPEEIWAHIQRAEATINCPQFHFRAEA